MSDFLDIKDEIIDGDPVYNIIDKDGNIINENVFIDLANTVVQDGTSLNKNLFTQVNGNLGYEKPRLSKEDFPEYILSDTPETVFTGLYSGTYSTVEIFHFSSGKTLAILDQDLDSYPEYKLYDENFNLLGSGLIGNNESYSGDYMAVELPTGEIVIYFQEGSNYYMMYMILNENGTIKKDRAYVTTSATGMHPKSVVVIGDYIYLSWYFSYGSNTPRNGIYRIPIANFSATEIFPESDSSSAYILYHREGDDFLSLFRIENENIILKKMNLESHEIIETKALTSTGTESNLYSVLPLDNKCSVVLRGAGGTGFYLDENYNRYDTRFAKGNTIDGEGGVLRLSGSSIVRYPKGEFERKLKYEVIDIKLNTDNKIIKIQTQEEKDDMLFDNTLNGIEIDTLLVNNAYYELIYKKEDNKFYAWRVRV